MIPLGSNLEPHGGEMKPQVGQLGSHGGHLGALKDLNGPQEMKGGSWGLLKFKWNFNKIS